MRACMTSLRLGRAIVLWIAWTLAAGAGAAQYAGTVSQVRDGDTVQVTTDEGEKLEVRLDGIDAPEKAFKGRKAQRFANEATDALRRLALNQRVAVDSDHSDKYGRRVGVLWVETENGAIDAGLMQVQLGLARVHPAYLESVPEELRPSYRYAEAIAKSKQRGLWSQPQSRRDAAAPASTRASVSSGASKSSAQGKSAKARSKSTAGAAAVKAKTAKAGTTAKAAASKPGHASRTPRPPVQAAPAASGT